MSVKVLPTHCGGKGGYLGVWTKSGGFRKHFTSGSHSSLQKANIQTNLNTCIPVKEELARNITRLGLERGESGKGVGHGRNEKLEIIKVGIVRGDGGETKSKVRKNRLLFTAGGVLRH